VIGCNSDLPLVSFEKNLINAVKKSGSGVVTIVVELSSNDQDKVPNERVGSGVIISSDGTIVTTHSVVEGGETFHVLFKDGCRHEGRILGVDRETNIALLITDTHEHGCFPVPMMEAEDSEVGSIGLVLGHNEVSKGIAVSWGVLSHTWIGGDDFWSDQLYVLQGGGMITQAGAGVVDVHGCLIGVCDNKINGHDGSWAVIPVSTLRKVEKVLKQDGSIQRGWLGICGEKPYQNPMYAKPGVTISKVIDGSPAANLGVKRGDVILAVNDAAVQDVSSLRRKITSNKPGQTVKLKVSSAEQLEQIMDITLDELINSKKRQRRCLTRSL